MGGYFSGGFAGITNVEPLKTAIAEYCGKIETILQMFNATSTKVEETYAGEAVRAQVKEYLASMKEYLIALANALKEENIKIDNAFEAWTKGAGAVSENVGSEAANIRSAAGSIKLD